MVGFIFKYQCNLKHKPYYIPTYYCIDLIFQEPKKNLNNIIYDFYNSVFYKTKMFKLSK